MNSLQLYALTLARVLMSLMFLVNGLGIISQATAAKELVEGGVPASVVPLLMLCARTLEVVAGCSLAFGIYPQPAAVALLVFLVPATLVGHPFWKAAGTAAYTPLLLNFLKNTSMTGGLLFMAATKAQPTLLPRFPRASRSKDREAPMREG